MTEDTPLPPHTPVQVRCSYDGSWVDGFEVSSSHFSDGGVTYELRRMFDGTHLPTEFNGNDVRPSR
jgi:hypothetical protein